MRRTLVLRSEQLTDLTAADLTVVAGGARTQADCPDNTYMCLTGYAICGASKLPVCV